MEIQSGPKNESISRVNPIPSTRVRHGELDEFQPFFRNAYSESENEADDPISAELDESEEAQSREVKPVALRRRAYTPEQITQELNRYLPLERNSIESAIGRVKRLIKLESPFKRANSRSRTH